MLVIIRACLFLGLLASLVTAVPSPNLQKRGVFKVERVRNANFQGHNGPQQLLKSLRKFRLNIPPSLLDAIRNQGAGVEPAADKISNSFAQSDQKGAATAGCSAVRIGNASAAGNASPGVGLVTASPTNGDVEYVSPVKIGGQTVNLDFDTGSSDLWVFSSMLAPASKKGHTVYDPNQSNSMKMLQGASFSISYGDGSGAKGVVGIDQVDIGGAVVPQQAVEMATSVSQSFVQDTGSSGLLGLAFSKINTVKPTQQKTFFDNVIPSLAQPVFTADLRKATPGAYEFGRIDNSKFTGTMAFVPVNSSQGFWQFPSTKFAVGGGAAQMANPNGQAIADTGTTLILADPAIVNGYYSKVPSAKNNPQEGGITVNCDATLPDLMLDIGGVYMARVKGSDINFAKLQACFGGLQSGGDTNLGVYGDIFFKSQYVAFMGGNNSLGIAAHA